ncbi:MAG: hypothetical protein WC979_10325, partial [Candidatus Pacearchaeota archaeon]
GILILLFLILSVNSSCVLNQFSNSLSSENLTFIDSQNITRNLTIPKNAIVTSAYLNLSGYLSPVFFYQESADTPNQTGIDGDYLLNYGGGYTITGGSWYFCFSTSLGGMGRIYDGDWDLCTYSKPYSTIMFNYKKPVGATGLIWKFRGAGSQGSVNLTIPDSCFDYDPNDIFLNLTSIYSVGGPPHLYCLNATGWVRLSGYPFVTTSSVVHEDAVWWEIPLLSLTNPYISVNSTKIWNHTGEFNSTYSPDKTLNFSSVLNNALNSGACDCEGCFLSGNNCTIPFIFHSDTTGVLEYSMIDIEYIPAPFVTLESPENNSFSPSVKNFTCSATDEIQLSNITFNFWNSTGDLNLSITKNLTGISNSTTYQMTFNSTDTFYWNCEATNNNSRSTSADNNYTINVDINSPVISLNYPSDNSYLNYKTNVEFNYTPEHSTQEIDTCILYSNSTGVWAKNQTDNSITKGVINTFKLNLSETSYSYTVWCNTSLTGNSAYSQYGNYTFTTDTIFPTISIDLPIKTTAGSQTISFNNTANDTNLDSCKYSIFDSDGNIDGLNNNVSFSCGTNVSATVTDYGTYNLTIFAVDLAGNENSTTESFTVSQLSSGGGGGSEIEVEKIPTIALKQIDSTVLYSELERAVFYARINTYCSIKKTEQTLAVQDFSGECSLKKSDMESILGNLISEGFAPTLNDMILFYGKFNEGELEQTYQTLDIVKTYDLFTSVLGITNEMLVNPPRLDRPFIIFQFEENPKIEYTFTVNKKIRECLVISGENLTCEILSDNSFKIIFVIEDSDFFDKIFQGEISVVSDADPQNIEVKRISLVPRVYNLSYSIAGVPIIAVLITFVSLIVIFSLFFVARSRLKKKLKRRKS